jgi:hypothetical protein
MATLSEVQLLHIQRLRSSERFFLLTLLISVRAEAQESAVQKTISAFENYLNMAGTQTAAEFRPLTTPTEN